MMTWILAGAIFYLGGSDPKMNCLLRPNGEEMHYNSLVAGEITSAQDVYLFCADASEKFRNIRGDLDIH